MFSICCLLFVVVCCCLLLFVVVCCCLSLVVGGCGCGCGCGCSCGCGCGCASSLSLWRLSLSLLWLLLLLHVGTLLFSRTSLRRTHAWHMVSTPAHAHVAQIPCLAHGKHTHPRARRSDATTGTWQAHPPTRMPLKRTLAWHMPSTPAHAHVAQTHPCLAHGKHTRPRACRSHAPMPGTR